MVGEHKIYILLYRYETMQMKSSFKLLTLFLVFTSLFAILVSAGIPPVQTSAVMKTDPILTTWKADGETLYRMDVYLDASDSPEQISTIDWRVEFPSYVDYIGSEIPQENFFYEGYTVNGFTNLDWQITETSVAGRMTIEELTNAPSNTEGNVATYWFKVDESALTGDHTFVLDNIVLGVYDPTYSACGSDFCSGLVEGTENEVFKIVKAKKPQEPLACSFVAGKFSTCAARIVSA